LTDTKTNSAIRGTGWRCICFDNACTSNRAINVIINNLKGIFFDDDDFEHMSCSIEASWGKIGMTEIRICDHRELRKSNVFR